MAKYCFEFPGNDVFEYISVTTYCRREKLIIHFFNNVLCYVVGTVLGSRDTEPMAQFCAQEIHNLMGDKNKHIGSKNHL